MCQIDQRWLWHRGMGHLNFDNLVKISKKRTIRDMQMIVKPLDPICKQCQHGMNTRVTFKTKDYSTSKKFIHTDHCGPTKTKSWQSEHCFMIFIDDYTIMPRVSFLKKKIEAFDIFKVSKGLLENETNLKIKFLRLVDGGEFTSDDFDKFSEMHGIKIHFSATRTPQHNGVAERKNRTMLEMAKTMLNDSKLLDIFGEK